MAGGRGKNRSKPGDPLTARQREAYLLIVEAVADRLSPPTMRELMTAMGLGPKSVNGAHGTVKALAKKGYITFDPPAGGSSGYRRIELPAIARAVGDLIREHGRRLAVGDGRTATTTRPRRRGDAEAA